MDASDTVDTASTVRWWPAALAQARSHRLTAAGLALALAFLAGLVAATLVLPSDGGMSPALRLALAGGGVAFAATALGALPALVLRGVPQKLEDAMLGAAAGMMLAASAFSLLMPGLEAGAAIVVLGMAIGVVLMLGLDAFTPHEHDKSGPCGPGHARCGRLWLFVFAIALHNLPEGMAIGVSFAQADLSVGVPLTTAIALQDLPEGLAVALALRAAGLATLPAVLVAAATGLLEPVGAVFGVALSSGLAAAYPLGLGLAAGAMIFVVSHEVIPETHRNGHQTFATVGLMGGFALMMVLDTALG